MRLELLIKPRAPSIFTQAGVERVYNRLSFFLNGLRLFLIGAATLHAVQKSYAAIQPQFKVLQLLFLF